MPVRLHEVQKCFVFFGIQSSKTLTTDTVILITKYQTRYVVTVLTYYV
jgi:hypothetical protein